MWRLYIISLSGQNSKFKMAVKPYKKKKKKKKAFKRHFQNQSTDFAAILREAHVAAINIKELKSFRLDRKQSFEGW